MRTFLRGVAVVALCAGLFLFQHLTQEPLPQSATSPVVTLPPAPAPVTAEVTPPSEPSTTVETAAATPPPTDDQSTDGTASEPETEMASAEPAPVTTPTPEQPVVVKKKHTHTEPSIELDTAEARQQYLLLNKGNIPSAASAEATLYVPFEKHTTSGLATK